MALSETNFINIKEKMNKINQRIDGLYQNWQAEIKKLLCQSNVRKFKSFMNHML